MYDCAPPFLILIAPCDICTPLVEPPPIDAVTVVRPVRFPSEVIAD